MNFTYAIQSRMDKKHMSKAELARRAGISKGGLSDFFNGKHSVNLSRLIKIADVLGVPVWRLVKEAEQYKEE